MNDIVPNLVGAGATFIIVMSCVVVHYEGLRALSRWITADVLTPRLRIVALIFGQLSLHISEIVIFALGYFVLSRNPTFGSFSQSRLHNSLEMNFTDQLYYSSVVYTTLGFGDVVPGGPLRLLTGVEAVAGLVLITWSASFTFLEMQRYWGRG